jgi:hypothetical protein
MSRCRAASSRGRGDDGQVGGIEALPFAVLVFVVGILLVANAWGVVDAKVATSAAAQEAARTYVEVVAGTDPYDATAAAVDAARDAAAGFGRDAARVSISVSPPGAVARCTRITVAATYTVPAIRLPWVGGFGRAISVTSRHSEVVDPFRSGVAGAAPCA